MLRLRITPLALLLCLGAACSPRDFLTRRLAADLIAGSETFKAEQKFWLRTGVTSNKDYFSPEYLLLQRRGWITAATAPCGHDIAPAPCWDVALTPQGVQTFRDLIPGGAPNSPYFSVPVARRQLSGITGISREGSLAEVDFQWKWVPLNEVGAALYAGNLEYRSTVAFRQYDDGWRVLEGNAVRSNQNLEDALKNSQTE